MGRLLVHRAESAQKRREAIELDEPLDKRVRLRPQRRFEAVHHFGSQPHLLRVVLVERQLKNDQKAINFTSPVFIALSRPSFPPEWWRWCTVPRREC